MEGLLDEDRLFLLLLLLLPATTRRFLPIHPRPLSLLFSLSSCESLHILNLLDLQTNILSENRIQLPPLFCLHRQLPCNLFLLLLALLLLHTLFGLPGFLCDSSFNVIFPVFFHGHTDCFIGIDPILLVFHTRVI